MVRRALSWFAGITLATAAFAGEPATTLPEAFLTIPAQQVNTPGIHFEILAGVPVVDKSSHRVQPALLAAISGWIARTVDLPPIADPPSVVFVPSRTMIAARYGGAPSAGWSPIAAGGHPFPAVDHADLLAIYNDATRTILLPEAWTGSTPAEMSVLVHELVHHLQNVARLKYDCPEAREAPAYAAQERWLASFGRSLEADFGLDPMTVLVRTSCFY